MQAIVKINTENSDRPTVMGRELHEVLEIKTRYDIWFNRMCEYGFTENSDFVLVVQKCTTNNPKNPYTTITDHQMTIDMAKEICMIQRSEKGKQCRQYFLEVEKRWNTPEAVMARALQMANKTLLTVKEENKALAEKIEKDKPLVDFALQVHDSTDLVDLQAFAKLIKKNHINVGRNKLFQWFRANKYLIPKGQHKNEPYQSYVDSGLFKVKEKLFETPTMTHIYRQTYITGKGQLYFAKKLSQEFGVKD